MKSTKRSLADREGRWGIARGSRAPRAVATARAPRRCATIEKHNSKLDGVPPKTYTLFTSTLLKELLKKISEIPAPLDYDAFGLTDLRVRKRRSEPVGVYLRIMSIEDVEAAALSLDPKDRAHLARRLLVSLESLSAEEIDRLWVEEAARRDEAVEAGSLSSRPAEAVFRDARARL